MESRYTIGQLAAAAGVPSSTLRYYERVGLLRPSGRSEGNYRLYGDADLERLRFIRAAQATGFTLDDVTTLLNHGHGSAPSCREVQALIERRLGEVKQRMADLRHVEGVLKAALDTCQQTEEPGHCEVIDQLSQGPRPAPDAPRPKRRKQTP